jgi:hypothetical protein
MINYSPYISLNAPNHGITVMCNRRNLFSQQIVLQWDFNFCLSAIDSSTLAALVTTVEFAYMFFSNLVCVKYLRLEETVIFLLHLGRRGS